MSNTLLNKIHPLQRSIICAVFSVVVFFVFNTYGLSNLMLGMVTWISFAFSYIFLCWIVFIKRNVEQIKKTAARDDGSAAFVFVMILVCSFASLFMVLLLMISQKYSDKGLIAITSVVGMLLSWVMLHTLFTFHYAHLYYNENHKAALGLNFPNDDKPDYIDFAYFSFVIGCTFQVSDVEITSKHVRRIAFAHSLISFLLNTFVVALTINLVAGARK